MVLLGRFKRFFGKQTRLAMARRKQKGMLLNHTCPHCGTFGKYSAVEGYNATCSVCGGKWNPCDTKVPEPLPSP